MSTQYLLRQNIKTIEDLRIAKLELEEGYEELISQIDQILTQR